MGKEQPAPLHPQPLFSDDELNLVKEVDCLIIFCFDVQAYFSRMLTLNNIKEVFILFVSAVFLFPGQCFINIQSGLFLVSHEE